VPLELNVPSDYVQPPPLRQHDDPALGIDGSPHSPSVHASRRGRNSLFRTCLFAAKASDVAMEELTLAYER
jgi:hypothetical protein